MNARTMIFVALLAILLLTAPLAASQEDAPGEDGDAPPEQATWGLCNAQDASQDGDDASNGTVSSTPPFANLTEDDCDAAAHPANGTPGADHAPFGPSDHPDGDDHPDGEDNPGADHRDGQGDDGDGGDDGDHPDQDDHPGEDDNPGDDRRP